MSAPLPEIAINKQKAYRLINAKLPTIHLFEDVASAEEFEDLYEIQAMVNPRLAAEAGDLAYISTDEIPWGIPGCSYATAAFTHVNPEGSRFSNGDFGMLYMADTMDTAIAEVSYHQEKYWQNVEGLKYDRFVFKGLACIFNGKPIHDATTLDPSDSVYDSEDYSAANSLGHDLRYQGSEGIQYHSVRNSGAICWGLFTPRGVASIVPTTHYEFIWDGERIASKEQIVSHNP